MNELAVRKSFSWLWVGSCTPLRLDTLLKTVASWVQIPVSFQGESKGSVNCTRASSGGATVSDADSLIDYEWY